MGRPKTIDHDKVKRAILEFLSPEKTVGMFLGYPTIRVYQYIVKFWKIRCSQKVVFNNLFELKEKGLVVCKKTRLGHYYWKGISETFLERSIGADVDISVRKILKMPVDKQTTNEKVKKEVETRRSELRRLGYNIDETEFLFRDPFPQFKTSWIKEDSPDTIINGLEDAYRRITPRSKKKARLLEELEYIRREEKEKRGFSLKEDEKCHRHWRKALPQMTMVFRKLLKELEKEKG